MLYFNQSFNYLTRKRKLNHKESLKCYSDNIYTDDYFRQHKSKHSKRYILVEDLIKQYGKAWLTLGIPQVFVNDDKPAVHSKYLKRIEEYMLHSGLNQSSILAGVKAVYRGIIIENDRTAIKPYELDIYLPDLKLAIEFNSIKYHTIQVVGSAYYHLKKSIKCRRAGIRLIHIYEFEDYTTQIKLLQDLILGIDRYPKFDFNKNNLIGCIPKPNIVYNDRQYTVYGAGKLMA